VGGGRKRERPLSCKFSPRLLTKIREGEGGGGRGKGERRRTRSFLAALPFWCATPKREGEGERLLYGVTSDCSSGVSGRGGEGGGKKREERKGEGGHRSLAAGAAMPKRGGKLFRVIGPHFLVSEKGEGGKKRGGDEPCGRFRSLWLSFMWKNEGNKSALPLHFFLKEEGREGKGKEREKRAISDRPTGTSESRSVEREGDCSRWRSLKGKGGGRKKSGDAHRLLSFAVPLHRPEEEGGRGSAVPSLVPIDSSLCGRSGRKGEEKGEEKPSTPFHHLVVK